MKTKEIKFTQEVKDNWLEALKSGDYVQGVYDLKKKNDKYCCLGVLCQITKGWSIAESGNSVVINDEDLDYRPLTELLGDDAMLSLTNENDKNCDDKYTSVIPLIEKLEVKN